LGRSSPPSDLAVYRERNTKSSRDVAGFFLAMLGGSSRRKRELSISVARGNSRHRYPTDTAEVTG
jgi:hypothetical protein